MKTILTRHIFNFVEETVNVHTQSKDTSHILTHNFCVWTLREIRYIQLFTGAPDGC